MIFRVTESMKYGSLTNSLSNIQVKSTSLMEKISTQKNINRPSDDPVGAGKILNYNSTLASIDQYQNNITNAQTWLSLTDTNLEAIKDIIAEAESAAMGATDDTMNANAAILSSLIDEALSLMNAKHGNSYIFGGSRTDVAPFSTTHISSSISNAITSTANKFDGTVTSGGAYTGTENKTYVVKIIDGGTPASLANVSYQISTDGGKNWGATFGPTSDPPSTLDTGIITLGDGVNIKFDDSAATQDLTADDLFSVKAYAAGYYRGNDDNLTVQVNKSNNYAYNITGSEAFTATNGPVASASLTTGTGENLRENDTVILTRGATVDSWTLTDHAQYPSMKIVSTSATEIYIDVDGTGADIITLPLSGQWSAGNTVSLSITGGTPGTVFSTVEVEGPGTVDLLGTLYALKAALEAHDENAVAAQIDDLKDIQTQVLQAQTEAGAKASNLDLINNNLTALNEQITSMKSKIEDADLDKLIVSYQMEQIALEASYNLAAQIGKMTILDYLR
jgi:flagellar hook-associated protein 3 FlgL